MKRKRYFTYISKPFTYTKSYIHNASSIQPKYYVYIDEALRLYIQSALNIEYMLIISDIHIFTSVYSNKNINSCRQFFAYMLPTWCNLLIISYNVGMQTKMQKITFYVSENGMLLIYSYLVLLTNNLTDFFDVFKCFSLSFFIGFLQPIHGQIIILLYYFPFIVNDSQFKLCIYIT